MLAKRNCGLVIALLLAVSTNYHVTSSSSPHVPPTPTSSPSLLPSISTSSSVEKSSPSTTTTTTSSTTTLTYEEPPKKPTNSNHPSSSSSSSRPKSSSVTFLYELYEQEIYNPKTDSWTSRRFTQSPVTGGGGRDSTSLDPQSCSPPRNYLFDGEWKIDMASESRDGFGWEYYVGKYDGLGRRRRRWVRNLKRISSVSKASAGGVSAKKKSLEEKKKKSTSSTSSSTTKLTKDKATRTYHPGLLQAIKDDYNFKGFGWGFYKPLLRAKSVGCLLRLPLSANFDSYDKHRAAPYITTATYFGYPWVVATFLNASVPLDAVKWLFGGVIWKMQWSLAVASALVRGVLEVALWVVLWPLRLWRTTIQLITTLARFGSKKKQDDVVESVIDSIDEVVAVNEEDAANTTFIDSGEGTTVSIETHIELSNSSQYKDGVELPPVLATSVAGTPRGGANSSHYTYGEELSPVLATSVADSPRGGANSSHYIDSGELSPVLATSVADSPRGGATDTANTTTQVSTFRKKHLTLLGNEIPSFHRTTSIEYSTTIQERVGASMSLRLSQERGFEFRYNFVYTCLPTFLLWRQIEEERRRRVETARRHFVGIWGKGKSPASIDKVHKTDASRGESKSSSKSRSKSQSNALSTFLNDHSSTVGVSAGWPLPVDPYFSLNLMLSMSGFYYGWLLKFIRSLFVLPLPSLKDNKLNQSAALSSGDKGSGSSPSEKVLSSALKKKNLAIVEETDDEGISILGESDSEECLANSTDLNVAGV